MCIRDRLTKLALKISTYKQFCYNTETPGKVVVKPHTDGFIVNFHSAKSRSCSWLTHWDGLPLRKSKFTYTNILLVTIILLRPTCNNILSSNSLYKNLKYYRSLYLFFFFNTLHSCFGLGPKFCHYCFRSLSISRRYKT